MRAAVLAIAILALPTVVFAQAEDRRREPTAGSPTSADPCADLSAERMRGPDTTWPGFDPRLPVPAGATSFTGIAPLGRDPSRGFPQVLQPDQSYSCRPSMNR